MARTSNYVTVGNLALKQSCAQHNAPQTNAYGRLRLVGGSSMPNYYETPSCASKPILSSYQILSTYVAVGIATAFVFITWALFH